MNRVKWTVAGIFSFILFFLIRDGFLVECGLDIVGNLKANFFLGSSIVGLVVIGILVTGKYKGWIASIPIICFATLIAIGISAWNTSCKENKQVKRDTLTEKAREDAVRILANMMVKRVKDRVAKELGLSQKKSGQTKRSYSRRTTTSKERVETPPSTGNWGQEIGTSTFLEAVNSWSRFAQTEAQKAMQRAANPGDRVKIE